MVWVVWQLVWTSTWQLGWKIRGTVRGRMVLPEVQHWKLVESSAECRHSASVTNDTAEVPQTSIQEKIAVLEKTLACMGNDEPVLVGKRVLEGELERHQKKLNGPKSTAKHIEAKQKKDQQRVQTHRGRECEAGGDAGESQRSDRNFESTSRGDQDTPRRPATDSHHVPGECGGNTKSRTTRIESAWRSRCEEAGWMDERWIDRGDCQLVGGSKDNFERSGSEEEETARGDRERIHKESRTKAWMVWMGLCRREGANADIASTICSSGLSEYTTDPKC